MGPKIPDEIIRDHAEGEYAKQKNLKGEKAKVPFCQGYVAGFKHANSLIGELVAEKLDEKYDIQEVQERTKSRLVDLNGQSFQ